MKHKTITKELLESGCVSDDCKAWILKYLGNSFKLNNLSKIRGDYRGYIRCLQEIVWSESTCVVETSNAAGIICDANLPVSSFTYNLNGDVLSMKKTNGDWCEYVYNMDGTVRQIKSSGGVELFYYDVCGRLTAIFSDGRCVINLLGLYN